MTKNEQIRQTLLATREKRQNQVLKVYELKVNVHSTSKEDFALFNSLFIQTKWIQNDMIASNDIFNYDYKNHRVIQNFDKDKNLVERNLTHKSFYSPLPAINASLHQCLFTSGGIV